MADIFQLPPGVVFDPIFDAGFGAMSLWLMIIIILIIALVIINFYWFYHFLVMAPVRQAGKASKSSDIKIQQTLLFSKNRSFSIKTLEYLNGILSFPENKFISKWMLTSPTSVGTVGFKSVLIASDSFDCIRDPIAELAICFIARELNKNNENLEIDSYSKIYAILPAIEQAYPAGIPMPVYANYDPAEIQKFTPVDRDPGMFGRMLIRDAQKLNVAQEDEGLEKYLPLLLFVAAGMIGIIMTYLYVSGAKSPVG
jgi:hypothetical protein